MHEDPRPAAVAAEVARIEADDKTMVTVRRIVDRRVAEGAADVELLREVASACGDGTTVRAFALTHVVGEMTGRESADASIGVAVGQAMTDALLDAYPQYGENPPPEVVERILDAAIRNVAESHGRSPEYVREVWNREGER